MKRTTMAIMHRKNLSWLCDLSTTLFITVFLAVNCNTKENERDQACELLIAYGKFIFLL